MALTPDIAGEWMPEEESEEQSGSAIFPMSPFEARAAAQQMPAGVTMDSRRMKRVKVNRPPSGKIDWRDLQKEQKAKGKDAR